MQVLFTFLPWRSSLISPTSQNLNLHVQTDLFGFWVSTDVELRDIKIKFTTKIKLDCGGFIRVKGVLVTDLLGTGGSAHKRQPQRSRCPVSHVFAEVASDTRSD